MDEDNVRTGLLKNALDALKNIAGDIKKGLLFLHNGKIVIRLDTESTQNLIQHLPMLPGNAHNGF